MQAFSTSGAEKFQAICIGTSQVLTTSSSSQQSTAVSDKTSIIRLFCTKDCFIAIGPNPTVTTSGTTGAFLPGGIIEYFGVNPNDKIAVIQVSASGTLYITEGR